MRTSLARPSLRALCLSLFLPLAAALVVAGEPARASDARPVLLQPSSGVGEKVARSSPKLLAAMQRDLHLTRGEAITRIGRQHAADAVEARARAAAGQHYAGSWLSSGGSTLMVAVTDRRVAAAVRAAGATPKLVTHSRGELEAARLELRARANRLPGTAVHGWHVDANRNRLLVSVAPGQQAAAAKWVAGAGVPAGLVAYETSRHLQERSADIIPGDAISTPRGGCTAGISVISPLTLAKGFITAGHCAFTGDQIRVGGLPVGFTAGSSFPTTRGPDRAYVQLNPGNEPLPVVRADVGAIPVLGTQAASVGATICRFGRTSGFGCGELTAVNREVVTTDPEHPDDPPMTSIGVNQMIPCTRPGDSGGPVITMAGQAQGTLTSSAPCGLSPLGPSYYQPINETLVAFMVEPLLFGPPVSIPPPTITAFTCSAYGTVTAPFVCDLHWSGGADPEVVTASTNGGQGPVTTFPDQNYARFTGTCYPYQITNASMTVTDAQGRRASASRGSFCPRGNN